MRLLIFCCAAPFFAALSACGVTAPIIEYPVLNELPEATNDAALVYFFQPKYRNKGASKRYRYVYGDDGDDFLGGLKPGSFFFVNFVPGTHNFSCLEIDLEAGQTYYLERGLNTQSGILQTSPRQAIDPRVHLDFKRLALQAPIDLCPPNFVAVKPEYAQPIITNLTYTIVKKD